MSLPPFYRRYAERVPEGDVTDILEGQIDATLAVARRFSPGREDHRYAPDKWSVREVLGHLADAERVFALRILWFARGSVAEQPGFDENEWAATSNAGERSLADLEGDLRAVRAATVSLLRGLPPSGWERRGTANSLTMSVASVARIVAGHELHHRAGLEERYLPGIAE